MPTCVFRERAASKRIVCFDEQELVGGIRDEHIEEFKTINDSRVNSGPFWQASSGRCIRGDWGEQANYAIGKRAKRSSGLGSNRGGLVPKQESRQLLCGDHFEEMTSKKN